MDDSIPRSRFFPAAASWFRPGSYAFAPAFLIFALTLALCFSLLPAFSFVLGTGLPAAWLTVLTAFGLIAALRWVLRYFFGDKTTTDGDSVLLDYFTQQNLLNGADDQEEAVDLLENALHLREVRAADCMAPRNEVIHIDVSASVAELRRLLADSKLSRVLVTDDSLDQVLGYVHVQQVFRSPESIRSMVMPIDFVPVTIPVNELLNRFIRRRSNIACVVDEYGSLAGIITLEDALEQLFGDIADEHDMEEYIETQVAENDFLFSGRLKIDYLNEHYPQLNLPEGDYQTLSGYLLHIIQNIPEQGDQLPLEGKIFIFELVSDRKIETVRIVLSA